MAEFTDEAWKGSEPGRDSSSTALLAIVILLGDSVFRELGARGLRTAAWLPDGKNDEPLLEKKQRVAAVENAWSWRVGIFALGPVPYELDGEEGWNYSNGGSRVNPVYISSNVGVSFRSDVSL